MRVAVPYDAAAHAAVPDVAGVLEAVDAVVEALTRLGHDATPIPVTRPLDRLVARLRRADLVFNLAESLGGRSVDEPRVAAVMAAARRPMTGSPARVLALCRRKDRLNEALAARGLPVPEWRVAGPGERPAWSHYPAVVKPVGEDGSIGVDAAAVADGPVELALALDRCRGPVLVQRFVGGREFAVGVVGRSVLPISEIRFVGAVRVVSYAAKWEPGSADDRGTLPVCPAALPSPVRTRLRTLALRAWIAAGGRGYGRVDLRMDEHGEPFLLEVNPNPDLAPGAGLARMARARGWSYDRLVDRIVREALT